MQYIYTHMLRWRYLGTYPVLVYLPTIYKYIYIYSKVRWGYIHNHNSTTQGFVWEAEWWELKRTFEGSSSSLSSS